MNYKLYDYKIEKILIENQDFLCLVSQKSDPLSLFLKLGDKLNNKGKILDSYYCFKKAYELRINSDDDIKAKISICLSSLALKLNKVNEAYKILSEALNDNLYVPSYKKSKILLNYILVLKKLKRFDEALDNILFFESSFGVNNINLFNLLTLKANILKEKGFSKNAVEIHKLLFDSSSNTEEKLVACCNILSIYLEDSNSYKLKEYMEIIEDLTYDYRYYNNKLYEADIYFSLFQYYKFIKDIAEADKFYRLAYVSAVANNNYNIADSCINSCFYINTKLKLS
ncbi:hypothetical protein [Clostridium manihotivorum]|uniref:Tetratricopeptide repeat protein n=1 Tax=Clostridium manihotivorum TaxID=2320868 RepID=A0A3R5U439_9CLOT|nr:hypothetical protein [Clostridium manihotivorum]QAA31134.1 hypothetical protein C1I91_05335 [Clostridium manihotivorum]